MFCACMISLEKPDSADIVQESDVFGAIALRLELCLGFLRTCATPVLLQQPHQGKDSGRDANKGSSFKAFLF